MPIRPDLRLAVGAAVREIRLRDDLSQEQVAQRVGVHLTSLARVELGKGNPTIETMRKIADALGVTLVEIFALAERVEIGR